MTFDVPYPPMDVLSRPILPADHRIPYGADASQFGDLWLPQPKPHALLPLVVFYHGGWWQSEYDLGYAGYLCRALKRAGIAVWSVEYRRVGRTGGGWPNTFSDAAAGFDYAAILAKAYPLDLARILTMGHSAGGHLAFWIAGRHHLAPDSELSPPPLQLSLRGAVSLAGAVDLRALIELSGNSIFAHDREEVFRLMGGTPQDLPGRYRNGDPGELLPFAAPQVLIQGTEDDQIPPQLPARWVTRSNRIGSHASAKIIPGADHFDVVDPERRAFDAVLSSVKSLLGT